MSLSITLSFDEIGFLLNLFARESVEPRCQSMSEFNLGHVEAVHAARLAQSLRARIMSGVCSERDAKDAGLVA